ncbi:MAG: ABC transporter permease subunit [Anaerolineaceae bacterium]|nr:ABC transporter permease subunit [Anaerolineaceae bacterium]
MKRRRDLLAALFLLPLFLYLLVFVLAPTLDTLGISLQHRENFGPVQFAGLANYVRLTGNPLLPSIAGFTFLQLASVVAISQALALTLALGAAMLWRRHARNPRAALLLLIGGVAGVFLYQDFGLDFSANRFRMVLIDFALLAWLPMEERWRIAGSMAHWVDTLGAVREFAGFTFCVYLCGALALPRDVLDAARVDGGPAWRRLGTVTLPLLAPTILVATALDLFRVVQVLDRPQITLSGSLGESGSTGLIFLIQVSFREGLFGYAAALLVASYVAAALAAALLGNSGVRWLRGAGWLGRANRMP